jgi:uncharacterized lipoprotein YmbA
MRLLRLSHRLLPVLLVLLLIACQSEPSRLYLLNSSPGPSFSAETVLVSPGAGRSSGQASAPVVAVRVTLPDYLDTTDIVLRTGANELKPDHDAQWGESLARAAARVMTENLAAGLPAAEVMMWPSRSSRAADYIVAVDLSRFDSDPAGDTVAEGRWTITDAAGREVASALVPREEKASGGGYDAMAAAMSRNLMGVSAEIARRFEVVSHPGTTAPGVLPARP